MADIMASAQAVNNEPDKVPSKDKPSQEPCPTFALHPSTKVADFDFKKEVVSSLQAQPGRHFFRKRTPDQIYGLNL